MISSNRKVGELVRVEWNEETGDVRIVIEVLDDVFKSRILHSKDLQDILVISGKDAMICSEDK